ncbi:MAG: TIGR00266 family protein [Vulcanimicrobiota bacterium]
MQYEIQCEGSFPVLEITLAPGDQLVSEAGAMAWMDTAVDCKTAARGGVGASLKRGLLGGESFFQNTYTTQSGGKVALVPGQPGDIRVTDMDGQRLMLERGAYLASGPNVQIDSNFKGLKGLFSEGLFVLTATGSGPMFWNGYGDIVEVQVEGDYIVDNGYAVAWDASLDYKVQRSSKKIRSFLFGDQLVMRFEGHGRVWTQSRSPRSLSAWVYPFRRVESKG